MAKKGNKRRNDYEVKPVQKQEETPLPVIPQPVTLAPLKPPSPWYYPYLVIFVFASLIYSNTLQNKYAIDDGIVLTENNYTKQGFKGIKKIMTTDAFEGFFGERGKNLISGGRYRPLSIATFAVEYEYYGMKPGRSHAINIFLFAITCLVLFFILHTVLPCATGRPFYLSLPFLITMLYAAHPIHTEAVANIKGRDEIMGMLFSLLALAASVQYIVTKNRIHLVWGVVMFFLGLLSKENAITFFAVIPLTLYFFTTAEKKNIALVAALYILPVALFLYMRHIYTAQGIAEESKEILNNPFAYATTMQRYATIVLTFLYYIKLLFVPHPLSHDYYYNQIPYSEFTDIGVVVSILLNVALAAIAIRLFMKRSVISYAILYYFITFSIVSNLCFTVGVLMKERFLFMPSLGFCIFLGYGIVWLAEKYKMTANNMLILFASVAFLYSVKTFSRNYDWESSFTIFKADVGHVPNSTKVQTSMGGELVGYSELEKDTAKKREMLNQAVGHLQKAIEIYPKNSNAWLLLGNASYMLRKPVDSVVNYYQKANEYYGGAFYDAIFNAGSVQLAHNLSRLAVRNLIISINLRPQNPLPKYRLAEAYFQLNSPDSAILWYNQYLMYPGADTALTAYKIGVCYGKMKGDLDNAIKYLEYAARLSPNVQVYWEDLAVAYGLKQRYDDAIRASEQIIRLNPHYAPAYMTMSVSYRNKGDTKKADELQAEAIRLSSNK